MSDLTESEETKRMVADLQGYLSSAVCRACICGSLYANQCNVECRSGRFYSEKSVRDWCNDGKWIVEVSKPGYQQFSLLARDEIVEMRLEDSLLNFTIIEIPE